MVEENPEFQFRGCFVRAEAMDLFEHGDISAEELALMMVINRRPHVSDEYLAGVFGHNVNKIGEIIADLTQKGLVVELKHGDGSRHLEPFWEYYPRTQIEGLANG